MSETGQMHGIVIVTCCRTYFSRLIILSKVLNSVLLNTIVSLEYVSEAEQPSFNLGVSNRKQYSTFFCSHFYLFFTCVFNYSYLGRIKI